MAWRVYERDFKGFKIQHEIWRQGDQLLEAIAVESV